MRRLDGWVIAKAGEARAQYTAGREETPKSQGIGDAQKVSVGSRIDDSADPIC